MTACLTLGHVIAFLLGGLVGWLGGFCHGWLTFVGAVWRTRKEA